MGIQTSSINSGPLAGFKNQVMNGNQSVWQRGTSTGSLTNGTTGAFVSDRWFIQTNTLGAGEAVTGTQSTTAPAGFDYSMQLAKTGTSAGTACFVLHAIELPATASPGPFYNGSTWTVSCWADFDLTTVTNGKFLVRFSQTVTGGASSGVFFNGGMTNTGITSNGFTKYTATFTINEAPPATTTCLRLIFQFESTAAYTRRITGFQLEQGPVATEFEQRPIGTELALCQRYFQKNRYNTYKGTYYGGINRFDGSTVGLPVQMRVAPTASYATVSGTNYWVEPGISGYSAATLANLGFNLTSSQWAMIQNRTAGGSTPTTFYTYNWEPEFDLSLSAEI